MTTPPPDNTRRETIEAAMRAIRDFVRVNDGDTLSRLRGDNTILATASGSWTGSAHLMLGHLRALASAEPQAREVADYPRATSEQRRNEHHCPYPECGCDHDAMCGEAVGRASTCPAPAPPAETEGLVERLTDEFREAVKKTTLAYCVEAQASYRQQRHAEELEARTALTSQLAARTQAPEIAEALARLATEADNVCDRAISPHIADFSRGRADAFREARQIALASTGSRQEPAGELVLTPKWERDYHRALCQHLPDAATSRAESDHDASYPAASK